MLNIIQFGIYLCLMLFIGYISLKNTKNNKDFIIGGRSLGPFVTSISAGASDMSSWLLLGLPGAVYASGLVEGVWISLGLTIGAYLNWLLVAGKLRVITEKLDAVTIPSYLSNRFEDSRNILKIFSTVVIMIFFTLYVASGLKGGTLLFSYTFNASKSVALIITTLVVVSYTFLGGYMAVCWTDLIQGLLMLTALVFTVILGFNYITNNTELIKSVNTNAFTFKTTIITGASLMAWGFGYFGQPHILSRFIGIDSVKSVPKARRIGVSWMVISLIFSITIGLIGIGYNAIIPLDGVAENSERIFLALSTALFHPLFSGFVLAAVLAAVMSTADSQLLVLTSSLTEDIPFFSKRGEKEKAWISRFGVLGFALIAFLIAFNDKGSILSMVGYAWGGFGAAFGPIIILSLLWKNTTKAGAITGILVGAATIFIVKNYIKIDGEYFYELLPGFILSFISIIIVSLFTKKPSKDMIELVEYLK
ncbi:sodium/proline symporter PutP [Thiospirochaeta perfilievii]|uniref:Sodium/proline symporter n=1 Tax=Thiospirochaeta perfilievii TaxID=252967 RepID=A0A5C1QFH5_9SPIO|nr:sodium/proline symporter PutP [Thiospirochaeta perfilievii]QEN06271.1 sodium/proline symporter PutP [Thiospirochaeta perfilievii]